MPTHSFLSVVCLTVSIASCGTSDPREAGLDALQRGRYFAAAEHLEDAIARTEPGTEQHLELAVARCRALANTDAPACQDEFLGVVATSASVTSKDFSMVADALVRANNYVEAIQILDAGVGKFPDDAAMEQQKASVVKESSRAADPEAIKKLRSLGYLGDDR